MADFINTIDLLGDDAVVDSIIDRTITEFKDDKVTMIGHSAFRSCTVLTTVDLPAATTMDYYVFHSCTALSSVNLPLVDKVHQSCFVNCTSLTEIVLPKAVDLNNAAFNGCTNLRMLDTSVARNIRTNALANCTSLSVLILRNETAIASLSGAITNSPIASGTGYIYVPGNLINDYVNATNWSVYGKQFRGLFDKEEINQGVISETIINLSDSDIQVIPNRGFYKYTPIETVSLPNCTEIGDSAFYSCSALNEVSFPRVDYVGGRAFNYCENLIEVKMPLAKNTGYTAFQYCTKLRKADFPVATEVSYGCFEMCRSLIALVLRSETLCPIKDSWQFNECNHFKGSANASFNPDSLKDGYVYVPRALVEQYQADTNWAQLDADRFRALEDYTVDGTVTGELDESKI